MTEFVGIDSPEIIPVSAEELARLKDITIVALLSAKRIHDELGEAGEEQIEKNLASIGNRLAEGRPSELLALRADWECEEAVLYTLSTSSIPIRVVSEEHDVVDLSENPRFLGVLDGLDGTGVYKKERGQGRYSTMLGIFEGISPTYDSYLVSGIMEHSTGKLFMAVKGGGAFVVEDGVTTPIHTSGKTELDTRLVFWADTAYKITNDTYTRKARPLKPFWRNFTAGSLATHHADVATGTADAAFECTRKGVLEEAISYGLIKEAGGDICDINGQSLGSRKYLEFGQDVQMPLVVAATPELAQAIADHIKSGFENRRAYYFAEFIRRHLPEYDLLKEFGLGPQQKDLNPDTKMYESKDWRNVSKHCILQAQAMEILANELGLSGEEASNLVTAAFIHDFYKVVEREKDKAKKAEGQTNEAIGEAEEESKVILRNRGYSDEIIQIVGSVGHLNMDRIMDPDCTLPERIMFLVDAATNDEVIIGAQAKTALMRQRNPSIEKAGMYDWLDMVTGAVEAELAARLGLEDPSQLYDWLNQKIMAKIMSWGAENFAGNTNR